MANESQLSYLQPPGITAAVCARTYVCQYTQTLVSVYAHQHRLAAVGAYSITDFNITIITNALCVSLDDITLEKKGVTAGRGSHLTKRFRSL